MASPGGAEVGGDAGGAGLLRKKAAAHQPAKKLVIKGFKAKPKLPENFEDETWGSLRAAVAAVHASTAVPLSFEQLYQSVEHLCIHRLGPRLHERLVGVLDAHVASQLAALQRDSAGADAELFLRRVQRVWSDHCDHMGKVRAMFLYLDRTYLLQTAGLRSLWDTGLGLFRTHLRGCAEAEARAVRELLWLVGRERSGEAVDRALLQALVRMFTSLGTYAEVFEAPFLQETARFYAEEGLARVQDTAVPEYLRHCEARLAEEAERCAVCLDPATRKPLVAAVEARLLEAHAGALLEKGFDALVEAHALEDLERMYALLARVGALDALRAAFSQHIRRAGEAVVKDEEKDKDMVETLLGMKSRMDEVVAAAFGRSEAFGNTLKDSFEQFINSRQNRPAELVAKFVDAKLRSGNKGSTDEELEGTLDRVLTLFRFIQGKDVFEAFYKKDLAKRLLLGKSASIDAEKSMISKLKQECGSQFTTKLEGMFKDVDLSRDIMASFRQALRERLPASTEMSVSVLTAGYWPTYPAVEVSLPKEIDDYQEVFKEFYLQKHSGRRLVWQNSLGHCVLRATFNCGVRELQVSLLQTVVLMLFNDAERLSLEEVAAATNMEDKELRRQLQSLACGKVRVLVKEPKGRDVEDGDCFVVNPGFAEKHYRVKVNSIQLKETQEENQQTNEKVFQDRQYQIDAAIVRIMKTRKTLSHSLLIAELMKQISFPARPQDLKKRIESLIEREYLERDRSNASIYNYLA
mmetsp:Transcript_21859/g.74292  ORF Transcript_21859/g.74292 Transcript_21859/m.74292 type:complete len:749 (+) Transcript_21859:229-2475(+)|eukprot:CAMPEP_0183813580 /NCGR_PEP_ID=MMETSP0803_2-20130417/53356_1 /TAXON_ID=195967 /ORGANISM="Crustomastix stigmata, Strain CCMP3273" /LENGTH=748 /DNA_ID=CAMNT_0026058439 /DNA_START=146 /DNA_END=2389 /DNA_ORIENTATION=+